jgi:hypothetical protein
MSNPIAPPVTYPSPNEWPKTLRTITNISNAAQAVVTCPTHGFTAADVNRTILDFLLVQGMDQIVGVPGTIIEIVDPDNFAINIDTTNFYQYRSGGYANIVAGNPPYDPYQNLFP